MLVCVSSDMVTALFNRFESGLTSSVSLVHTIMGRHLSALFIRSWGGSHLSDVNQRWKGEDYLFHGTSSLTLTIGACRKGFKSV